MLPASVAAAARDTSEIFKFGLEIVAISFRLALEVKRRSRLIEDTPKSWGCTLVGPSSDQIQRVLDAFNDQNVNHLTLLKTSCDIDSNLLRPGNSCS